MIRCGLDTFRVQIRFAGNQHMSGFHMQKGTKENCCLRLFSAASKIYHGRSALPWHTRSFLVCAVCWRVEVKMKSSVFESLLFLTLQTRQINADCSRSKFDWNFSQLHIIHDIVHGRGGVERHDGTVFHGHPWIQESVHHQSSLWVVTNGIVSALIFAISLQNMKWMTKFVLQDVHVLAQLFCLLSCNLRCPGNCICYCLSIRGRPRSSGKDLPSVLHCAEVCNTLHVNNVECCLFLSQVAQTFVTGAGGPVLGMFLVSFFVPYINAWVRAYLSKVMYLSTGILGLLNSRYFKIPALKLFLRAGREYWNNSCTWLEHVACDRTNTDQAVSNLSGNKRCQLQHEYYDQAGAWKSVSISNEDTTKKDVPKKPTQFARMTNNLAQGACVSFSSEGVFVLYRMSFLYFAGLGVFLAFVLSILFSFLTGLCWFVNLVDVIVSRVIAFTIVVARFKDNHLNWELGHEWNYHCFFCSYEFPLLKMYTDKTNRGTTNL